MTAHLTPALTPHGRLLLVAADDVPPLDTAVARRLIDAFERGSGHGLLQLGGAEIGEPLPPALGYWREFGTRYVAGAMRAARKKGGRKRRSALEAELHRSRGE